MIFEKMVTVIFLEFLEFFFQFFFSKNFEKFANGLSIFRKICKCFINFFEKFANVLSIFSKNLQILYQFFEKNEKNGHSSFFSKKMKKNNHFYK
jgi:hypothetical protein